MTETKKVDEKAANVGASFGSDKFFEELDQMLHSGSIKVAPAAGWWMRTYMILPSEVKTTGPKGFILKGDVLDHIEKNKLQKGVRSGADVAKPAAAKKGDAPKKPSAPKAQPKSQAADPKNPFT